MALRRGRIDPLVLAEGARAGVAALRPVLDDFVHPPERKQPAVRALVSGLAAAAPPRPRRRRPGRRRRRVLRGRQRGVARTALEPPLKLGHPGLEPPVRLHQLADLHQQRDRGLPITIENRLRLGPLHNLEFATPERVPSGEVNAYRKWPVCSEIVFTHPTGIALERRRMPFTPSDATLAKRGRRGQVVFRRG